MRTGEVRRKTQETNITLKLKLDGSGKRVVATGVGFLDHMLTLFAGHGVFDLNVRAKGDLEVDDHHLVEDVGICLGEAIKEALGDKAGLRRVGSVAVPMDEALVLASLDLSGRAHLSLDLTLKRKRVGTFDTELVEEFFQAVTRAAGMTLHLRQLAGTNTHHIIEAAFKAFARALDDATQLDVRVTGIPSTKGRL
jgi:imidazoleglycerol-phosphate dehydratase